MGVNALGLRVFRCDLQNQNQTGMEPMRFKLGVSIVSRKAGEPNGCEPMKKWTKNVFAVNVV